MFRLKTEIMIIKKLYRVFFKFVIALNFKQRQIIWTDLISCNYELISATQKLLFILIDYEWI